MEIDSVYTEENTKELKLMSLNSEIGEIDDEIKWLNDLSQKLSQLPSPTYEITEPKETNTSKLTNLERELDASNQLLKKLKSEIKVQKILGNLTYTKSHSKTIVYGFFGIAGLITIKTIFVNILDNYL
eukprot:GAHX01000983.1.p1 GENE.GAHX01000983.1~~GAHX01000983.1.p1  ORF type:complete len:128 (+),score=30.02 GAHX01000983.1:65-448(+)